MTTTLDALPIEPTKINNEAEAFEYLRQVLELEWNADNAQVEFQNWPVVAIKLEGKGYDSTITPQMAEALVELQHALNRAYARLVRGVANAKVLTNEQRNQIEFKAKVEKGSSLIEINLGPFASSLSTALIGKMEPAHVVLAVIGTAAVAGSVIAYKAFLKHKSEDKKVDAEVQKSIALSQQETKRLELMKSALDVEPALEGIRRDFDDVRQAILKGTSDAKSITVQDVKLEAGQARVIAMTPRQTATEVQLNGRYRIDKLDWTREGEVRISVYAVGTAETLEFTAKLNTQGLSKQHKDRLQAAEWDRRSLHLQVNATRLRGEITTATIVGIEWPQDDADKPAVRS